MRWNPRCYPFHRDCWHLMFQRGQINLRWFAFIKHVLTAFRKNWPHKRSSTMNKSFIFHQASFKCLARFQSQIIHINGFLLESSFFLFMDSFWDDHIKSIATLWNNTCFQFNQIKSSYYTTFKLREFDKTKNK